MSKRGESRCPPGSSNSDPCCSPTWAPGEAIGAVSEAIDTLRTAWVFDSEDVGARAAALAPAHRIGIWVGGAGPRMLDLIGRKADGWIAPMATGYETKPAVQERIDTAATDAGRDPVAVGRMIQLVGRVIGTASTISRRRSGPGNQAIHTAPEHWGRIVAEFAVKERFNAGTSFSKTRLAIRSSGSEQRSSLLLQRFLRVPRPGTRRRDKKGSWRNSPGPITVANAQPGAVDPASTGATGA